MRYPMPGAQNSSALGDRAEGGLETELQSKSQVRAASRFRFARDPPSKARLVVKIEVDEVPVPDKPGKADASDRHDDVKNFCPDPPAGFGPAVERIDEDDQGTESTQDSNELGEIQEGIAAAAEVCDVVGARDKDGPGDQEDQIQNPDDPHGEAQALLGRSEFQISSVVPAYGGADRPEQ